MTGSGGVRLERWGAFALLLVSAGGTWTLSERAAAVAEATSCREEQLEHLATLVGTRGDPNRTAGDTLPWSDGLFAGHRVVWSETVAGRILTLQAVGSEGEGR